MSPPIRIGVLPSFLVTHCFRLMITPPAPYRKPFNQDECLHSVEAISVAIARVLQDVPFGKVLVDVNGFDIGQLVNGTWSGWLGEMQRGNVDTVVADFDVNVDRFTHFKFATPLISNKLAILLRRNHVKLLDFDGLTAGLTFYIYARVFLFVGILLSITYMTKRYMYTSTIVCRTAPSSWTWLQSVLPGRTAHIDDVQLVSHRLLVITTAIALFMFIAVYQAMILTSLMIAPSPPMNTFTNVANMIARSNGAQRIIFRANNSAAEHRLSESADPAIRVVQKTIHNYPPIIMPNLTAAIIEKVLVNGDVIIYETLAIRHSLNEIDARLCDDLELVGIDQLPSNWVGIMVNSKRRDLLEEINRIIEVKYDYLQRLMSEKQLNDDCSGRLFTNNHSRIRYTSIDIYDIGAVFIALIVLLFVALVWW